MKKQLSKVGIPLLVGLSPWMMLALSPSAQASTAYGTLNNFDCVNDTGVEAHGFEIELDDVHSTDITYTYDYNHYGIPKIREDNTDPAHPKVFIRYAAARNPDGSWTAFTAIPSGPITPTDGHQFTNPSVNFGGEHFGTGYYGAPTAVKYNWLIDDGTGNLVHGPPVYVATPTFTYFPAVAQVQAVIVPPPPPAPPVLQFGEATWVKDIKTTTHNAEKVELRDLVDPDPDDPAAQNWTNGEPAEVETEWRILQTEFADAGNPKGVLEGAPQDRPDGNEVITRRYEFYKYTGPLDAESGEAMADEVGPDGIHGVGSVTFNDHIGPDGEWVEATVDLSTVEVVGDFFGAQMAGFDVAPALGLIDHIPDGELNVAYADRTVVVAGGAAFLATISGSPPDGTTLDLVTGIFSGTPIVAGVFTFTVEASDTSGAFVSKTYIVTIPEGVPVTSTIATSSSPAEGGSTAGDGVYDNGTPVTVVATHNAGYAFVNWTEGGAEVSASAVYPFTVNGDRTLVANFLLGGCTTDADCADVDACTTDVCVDGVCDHQLIASCCNADGQCDDGVNCTLDVCVNHACAHEDIPACCNTDAECTDADACTVDVCVDGVCQHQPIAGCCNADGQCDDGDDCTRDVCVDHACTQEKDPACCNTDAECADTDDCTLDACVDHQCRHTTAPGCCVSDGDCNDGDVCTTDLCVNHVCERETIVGCCRTDAECDDSDPCTQDTCKTNACVYDPVVDCCTVDAQCPDANPCTLDFCNMAANHCGHQPLPDCCIVDTDCDDGDACTTDRCENSVCTHGSAADCCRTDADCDDGDPCTADHCVDNVCRNNLIDDPPLTLVCPADVIRAADPGACSAIVSYELPVASDHCSDVSVSCDPPSGSTFLVGTTTVNCTASNVAGTAGCSFTVTVTTGHRCPRTRSFWVKHPDLWPVDSLTVGIQVYSKAELLGILTNSPRADASLQLAWQLIAAMLSTAGGSDPSPICETVAHANGLLGGYGGKLPYRVKASSAIGKAMLGDAAILQAYSGRSLTPDCKP